MEVFRVAGGARLAGEVTVDGAKNSVLKLMAAAILAQGTTVLHNVPDILDVSIMAEVLSRLGATVTREPGTVRIAVPGELGVEADYRLVRQMRASIAVLGPLVTRFGRARVALPGGDVIGTRAVDFHIMGLELLGAQVRSEHGYLIAEADRLRGTQVDFGFPSVGATENVLMAAVIADGQTIIENAAREPEIVDLAEMLVAMGARIDGAGTPRITIDGVERLHAVEHRTVGDRIVAGTFAVGAVMTGGDVRVRGVLSAHLETPLKRLREAGAQITAHEDGFSVRMKGRPRSRDVVTLPFPGFPTDLQPMMIALNAIADGNAVLSENIFEGRFMFANELARLGARVTVDGQYCGIHGVERLSAAPVEATDIRAGAGLVLAGLVAEGVTEVAGIAHIDRGYPNFDDQLRSLGADVVRREVPDFNFVE